MGKLTWIGDSDPAAQSVTLYGHTFVKGEPVEVKDKETAEKLSNNPLFTTDKGELTKADEPSEEAQVEAAEAGTEKGAIKAQLRSLGAEVPKGNASVETLRTALSKALNG